MSSTCQTSDFAFDTQIFSFAYLFQCTLFPHILRHHQYRVIFINFPSRGLYCLSFALWRYSLASSSLIVVSILLLGEGGQKLRNSRNDILFRAIKRTLQTVSQFQYLRLSCTNETHRYVGSGPLRTWRRNGPNRSCLQSMLLDRLIHWRHQTYSSSLITPCLANLLPEILPFSSPRPLFPPSFPSLQYFAFATQLSTQETAPEGDILYSKRNDSTSAGLNT